MRIGPVITVWLRHAANRLFAILSQTRREGGVGVSYPRSRYVWGLRCRSEIHKYTRMRHFEKKNSIFL